MAAPRLQTMYLLHLSNMVTGKSSYTFNFSEPLKQSRQGYKTPCVKLCAYPVDKRLCVVNTLREYLKRTDSVRTSEDKLFVSFVKPHKAVTTDTIGRWIKAVMSNAGIDTDKFKAHSVRAAACSKAKTNCVPVEHILSTAGWSSSCTFAKYYNKTIVQDNTFSNAVLST